MPANNQSAPLTREELAEIAARLPLTSDPPWIIKGTEVVCDRGVICDVPTPRTKGVFDCAENRTFIAHARTDIPRLLATVASLQARVDAAEAELSRLRQIRMDELGITEEDIADTMPPKQEDQYGR